MRIGLRMAHSSCMRCRGGVVLAIAVTAIGMLTTGVVPSSVAASPVHSIPGTNCPLFPADNVWHADISKLPVNSHNAAWMRAIGRQDDLHPDFGPSYGAQPVPYGIPVTVVTNAHPTVKVDFQYAHESDRVRYPLGRDTKIEGGRNSSGDRHAIIVNKTICTLYETFATQQHGKRWSAGSGAVWSLTSDKLRHNGWTSADAAGLPILPGLLRYAEVKRGFVDHAIRFTAPVTSRHYIWPARHAAGSRNSLRYPPMGARFRLKASFSESGYSPAARVVINAMKTYGLILADNGSSWYFQGDASRGWKGHLLSELKTIPAKDFQAVDESGLQLAKNSGAAR